MDLSQLNSLNLLYVEDDDKLRANYLSTLSMLFKKVYEASDYQSALKIYKDSSIDILLVDINLGALSGLQLAKEIRKSDIKTPIVFLTAHSDNKYLLEAANLQIDGYIVKPLDLEKLQQSMMNCLKKIEKEKIVYIDKQCYYNLISQELYKDDKVLHVGKKTNQLLKLFIENKNQTLTKENIEYYLWSEKSVTESSIKNLIGQVRKAIGKEKIVNVLGVGWKLNLE